MKGKRGRRQWKGGFGVSQQPVLSISPNWLYDNIPGPQVLEQPPPQPWAEDSRTQSQVSSLLHALFSIRPGHGCLLSHLCSLEHREPIEVFVGGVRGAAAPIARPGSRLSCILNRDGVDCSLWPRTVSHLIAHRATRPSLQPSHFLEQSSLVAPFPELLPFPRE